MAYYIKIFQLFSQYQAPQIQEQKKIRSYSIQEETILKVDGSILNSDDEGDLQYPKQLRFKTLKSKGFYDRTSSRERIRGNCHHKRIHSQSQSQNQSREERSTSNEKTHSYDRSTAQYNISSQEKNTSLKKEKDEQSIEKEQKKPILKNKSLHSLPSRDNLESKTDIKSQTNLSTKAEKQQSRSRSYRVPTQKKKVAKEVKPQPILSSDTDEHLCEECYIDKLVHDFEKEDDYMSDDSDNSWDSDCARIYAEVAAKEVYDPSKLQKIVNTKVYKEEKMYKQQLLQSQLNEQLNAQNAQMQQQQNARYSQLKSNIQQQGQQANQRKKYSEEIQNISKSQIQQSPTKERAQQKQTITQTQSQVQKTSSLKGMRKRTSSEHAIHVVDIQQDVPEILKTRRAPQMEQAPKDRYKIHELVEEMIKQNNRIYKAEMQKSFQDKLEQQERDQQRKENLKERFKFIQSKHREQYLKKLEEKQLNQEEQNIHDYQWGLDQRKFNPQQKQASDVPLSEFRKQKREEKNIDKYFSEFLVKVQEKIRRRKKDLKKETLKKSKLAQKEFLQSDVKQKEKNWTNIIPKELKQEEQDNQQRIDKELKEKEEKLQQQILEERKLKFQSSNKRHLSAHDKEAAKQERGMRALSQVKSEKKQKIKEKLKKKNALKKIQDKASEQLLKSKKREFHTLSSMNFDFSDFEDEHVVNKQKNAKQLSKKQQSSKPILSKQTKSDKPQTQSQQIKKQQQPQITKKENVNTQNQNKNVLDNKDANQQKKSTARFQDESQIKNEKQKQQTSQTESILKTKQEQQKVSYSQKDQQMIGKEKNKQQQSQQNQFQSRDHTEDEIVIDQEQYEKIQQNNQAMGKKVNQLVGSMNLGNVKSKSDWGQSSQQNKKEQEFVDENSSKMNQLYSQELPEDFIEKIFTTAEMHDLPKEYVQANERKEEKMGGSQFKKFEREIQNEIYKRNEKPVHHSYEQKSKKKQSGVHTPAQSKIPPNTKQEKARMNNYESKSTKPTQHLLQGEFVYKESQYDGVREIKHVHPKPKQMSQEEYKLREQERNKVKIIEPAIPPIEMRRRNEKQKSLKEQYMEEYKQIQKDEQKQKDEQIRKQQQYILQYDLEDDIFEMANKVAFHKNATNKADKKKEVEKTFGFDEDEDSEQDLYADGIEAYNKARQEMIPDVLKNISKSNFASLIIKQKQDRSSQNYSND